MYAATFHEKNALSRAVIIMQHFLGHLLHENQLKTKLVMA